PTSNWTVARASGRLRCLRAAPLHRVHMTLAPLILKRASASRPSGKWSDDDFDVLADGVVVGRIMNAAAAPVGSSWLWTYGFDRSGAWEAGGLIFLPTVRRAVRAIADHRPPRLRPI